MVWCLVQDTCMSFAVSLDEGAIEWSSDNVRTLKGKRYVQVCGKSSDDRDTFKHRVIGHDDI